MRSFKTRLADLERLDRAWHGPCRGYIVLNEAGAVIKPCPCGRDDDTHKAYVSASPDDWDANEP